MKADSSQLQDLNNYYKQLQKRIQEAETRIKRLQNSNNGNSNEKNTNSSPGNITEFEFDITKGGK